LRLTSIAAVQDANAYSAPRRCAVHFADC